MPGSIGILKLEHYFRRNCIFCHSPDVTDEDWWLFPGFTSVGGRTSYHKKVKVFLSQVFLFLWKCSFVRWRWFFIFSGEPALSTLLSQERVCMRKKSIDIFNYKQWLLSIDMKTKVVQHVPRINLSHFKFWILNLNFQIFKFKFFNFQIFIIFFLVPSFCLTFRHFFLEVQ